MEPKKNPSKDVHRYSKQYFLIGLIISCSIAIMAFEWETEKINIDFQYEPRPETAIEVYHVPVVAEPQIQSNKPPVKKIQLIDPSRLVTDPATYKTDDSDPIAIEPETATGTIEFIPEIEPESVQDTFIIVEHMPVPAGGFKKFYEQVSRLIKYPSKARQTKTEGTVYIEFVINETGDPVNLKVTKGIGRGCDEEAKRILGLMKWEPGKQRGRPVLVRMTLPFSFKLQ